MYLIYGPEEYLKNKTAEMIFNRLVTPESKDFDFITLYGDSMTPIDAVEGFSTKPFLSEHKIVFIKNFHSLKTSYQEKIIQEFGKFNIDNILVITSDTFDSRLKLSKEILRLGEVIQCKSPYRAEEMIPWLNEEMKARGKLIDPQAALLFVNKIDLDFNYAANELEKLSLFCKDKKNITTMDVQLCTGDSKSHNIFDFINKVGERNIRESFIIMENLLDNDEGALFIIVMLTRFFLQVWRINYLRGQRYSDMAIKSNHLNDIHSFFRNNYLGYARNYPLRSIPDIFAILLETDTEVKSINIDEKIIAERMLFKIFSLK